MNEPSLYEQPEHRPGTMAIITLVLFFMICGAVMAAMRVAPIIEAKLFHITTQEAKK